MIASETKEQCYENYKDSGISWLEEIPHHWELKRFKHIFKEKKITHNVELNCGSISFGKVVYKDDEKIPVSTKKSYQVLNNGEFLINPLNLNYDLKSLRIALSDKDVVVSSGYIIVQNISEISKDYYKWLLHIFDVAYMKTLGSGVRQTLSFTHIANSELVFPPLQEQTAIAQFLDDKTTKIDEAIAIKEQQINLLKEREQILIHKAVTRGLDDSVLLKDSGVEWIGAIPEGWTLSKNGYISRIIRGASPRPAGHPMYFDGTDVPWLAVGDITKNENIYLNEAVNFLTNAGKKQSRYILKGTFVLSNSGATLGVPKILNISGCINDGILAFLDLKEELIDKIFLYYYFASQTKRLRDEMNQGATQPNLNTDLVKQLPIALPPLLEQKEISAYIETASQKIETAIGLKEQEIEKLKEYKSSLINSVVTGKVRVC
ncbi:MAG: restriction endonuclease subunit S [Flavobacteriaceae bacterium]|nr:restriction endonuclease subunit S [Flavobacteriaceae bacterium]|tara:strand:- start:15480 stop:16778 length:1299 start_codon:yes stop_codon:yes gene_type:complete